MGPDGHTASLFPGVAELDQPDGDELVAATTDPNGHNPHPRLTVTLPAIAAARLAVFTVAGDTKRQAMDELLAGRDIPAARVRARAIRWLVDEAAMGTDPATTT
jgi:6-phosphogluconolactonase